jgi:hypothetical protein
MNAQKWVGCTMPLWQGSDMPLTRDVESTWQSDTGEGRDRSMTSASHDPLLSYPHHS